VLQGLDDAAAAAGDHDTSFADGADAMAAASVLAATAFSVMLCTTMLVLPVSGSQDCSNFSRGVLVIVVFVFALATTAMTVAAAVLTLTSSQLNADHWESATDCKIEVLWEDGVNCLISSAALLLIMMVYMVFGPTPEEHLLEPNWFVRRALSLQVTVDSRPQSTAAGIVPRM
jgi:hypothetical protein